MTIEKPYVILVSGAFYRPNRSGYTNYVAAAGIYTLAEAMAEKANRPKEVHIAPLEDYKAELNFMRNLVEARLYQLKLYDDSIRAIERAPGPAFVVSDEQLMRVIVAETPLAEVYFNKEDQRK